MERPWARQLIRKFLKLNGNCVFFMDYSNYSLLWYSSLTPHFKAICEVLTEKVKAIVRSNFDRVTMFGFSFGARLVINTGIALAKEGSKLGKIFACDPASSSFENYDTDMKKAAKFVQCIHTSNTLGTSVYDCHQNWRMGKCGESQHWRAAISLWLPWTL
jgi:predicted esterase